MSFTKKLLISYKSNRYLENCSNNCFRLSTENRKVGSEIWIWNWKSHLPMALVTMSVDTFPYIQKYFHRISKLRVIRSKVYRINMPHSYNYDEMHIRLQELPEGQKDDITLSCSSHLTWLIVSLDRSFEWFPYNGTAISNRRKS